MVRRIVISTIVLAALAAIAVQASPALVEPPGPAPNLDESGRSGEPVPVPEPNENTLSYYRSGNVLWSVHVAWSLLIPALFLFTGFSARIRNWAAAIGRGWFLTIGVYFVIFCAILFVINLPLSFVTYYLRPHAFDLSNQTLAKWFGDALKGLVISAVTGFLFLWVPYLLLRKSPRRWWLYTGLLLVPFVCFLVLVQPVVIDPMFNESGPLEDERLEARIVQLADRAGIDDVKVYQVAKSVDTKAAGAYVTGLLGTKRIILWDTMIEKMNEEELSFIVAHEMGHYTLGHFGQWIAVYCALILGSLYVAHRLSEAMLRRFHLRFGFRRLADVASLPLIILLMNFFLLAATPLALGFLRHNERIADTYGLELTRDNHAAATAFVKLQHRNLVHPRPGLFYKLWRASHPPLGERVDFCNSYRPWATGEPLRYPDRFTEEP
jgi:Zn-dependent protease with chaperone function